MSLEHLPQEKNALTALLLRFKDEGVTSSYLFTRPWPTLAQIDLLQTFVQGVSFQPVKLFQ